ncbi:hypothetical protein PUMCH_001291 [Australozyma saopauloensis]|uniref:Cleavage/polyadenylation specificity factor A subunit C-terminal domain-containing protein n=1 Tax=Australozyma saopauloensis TaxID=291208 RepID=A0AAX4H6F8_9ASCO|nr:hypothetical protein PUMCH_001291 [[Candida] saopauloensis]
MNAYDVFLEPSAVSKSLACNFISSNEKHLVVGKATTLEIYEVLRLKNGQPLASDYKLKLIALYKLQGLITDLCAIRTAENPHLDYVLVSTKSAKVSCIKWNPYKHNIATVSLHYYEHVLQNLTYETVYESSLTVSPSQNSVFCLRRNNMLVLLPFNRVEEEIDGEEDGHAKSMDVVEGEKKDEDRERGQVPLFGSSTVVDIETVDPTVGEIIDFQFLHNYRDPTLAIVSHRKSTWAGVLPKEKDTVLFTVLSLDVQTASTTTILQIENLPYDIHKVVPLPSPLSGSLLLGCNEIIHVDNSGITRRIALNSYTTDITSSIKSFQDQTDLDIKLENCTVCAIPNDSRVLLALENGDFYYATFEVDGKTIKKFAIEPIDKNLYQSLQKYQHSGIIALDDNLLFFMGTTCNSVLVELSYTSSDDNNAVDKGEAIEVTTSDSKMLDNDDDEDLYDEDDKDKEKEVKSGQIEFIVRDELFNHAPISSFALGNYSTEKIVAKLPNPSFNDVSIFAAGGLGLSGQLNIITPTIQPIIKSSLRFSQLNRLWTINNKYLITSDDLNQKSELFDVNQSYARLSPKHFVNNELTIAMHELNHGQFILQVTPRHIIMFSNKFRKVLSLDKGLKELEDGDIINSVFNDDFLMIFFSSGEVVIYSVDSENKSFTRIELPMSLQDTIITTGYIANSKLLNAVLKDLNLITNRGQKRKRNGDAASLKAVSPIEGKQMIFILVTGDNRIVLFGRDHKDVCFQLDFVNIFSDTLQINFFDINSGDPDPFIKQVILNDLGDEFTKEEYLTILTVGGEIYSYKLYFDGESYSLIKQYNLPMTGAPFNAYAHGTSIERRMIYFPNINGTTCIMVTGVIPYLITRSRHSQVRIFKFSKIPIVSFVPYSDEKIKNGLIYLDTKKNARIVELPNDFNYDNTWPIKKIYIGETVKSVAYHETSRTVILSTFKEIPYDCIDEEGNPIVGLKTEKPRTFNYKGQIRLISPLSWTTIDTIELLDNEVGLQIKSVVLDVGSETKRFKSKKEFVLLGTGRLRMEDLACNGSYKILEIIDIIPEPGKPETNHKFKEFTEEATKGAVTSICDVSGRFLVAQGQKMIVRDIKDNTAVSVAFLDASVYVSETKSFGNLVLFGDTLKSVSLAGFDAEPFRMIPLGKDLHELDVSSADFVAYDQDIHIIVADNDKALHVLLYNPDDPSSSNGQRLLHRSTLNTNFNTTCTRSLAKHEQINPWLDPTTLPFQVVGSTVEGAMYTVFPVSEATYRRMYILQQQLIDKEFHACGLNPKLNRFALVKNESSLSLRPLLDCELLRKYSKLNQDRMRTLGQKVSIKNVSVDLWKDLIEFENVLNNL